MPDNLSIIYGALGLFSGLLLFSKNPILRKNEKLSHFDSDLNISVIIPARNEEKNLPNILKDLEHQTVKPLEVIVVDDGSTDRTEEIAKSFNIKLLRLQDLPDGWIGKSWALWNGSKIAQGNVYIFLDADVRLIPESLALLMDKFRKSQGVISVWPFYKTVLPYEKLSIIFNVISGLSLTSRIDKNPGGIFGPCVIVKKSDYEMIEGHSSVKSKVLEDLFLGKTFRKNSIKVNNFLGGDTISFRMYPSGLKSLIEGWTKNFATGSINISVKTFVFLFLWIWGLIAVGIKLPLNIVLGRHVNIEHIALYSAYAGELYYISSQMGSFGVLICLFNFVPSVFFVLVFFNSLIRAIFIRKISWKGRTIRTGGRN